MLTRQQLYELSHSGFERMLHFVEQLLSHLAEVERHVGHRQQYTIDRLLKDVGRLVARVERLKAQLLKQQMLNYQLTRRIQELQVELTRREGQRSEVAPPGVRRDSHNSGLPPSLVHIPEQRDRRFRTDRDHRFRSIVIIVSAINVTGFRCPRNP